MKRRKIEPTHIFVGLIILTIAILGIANNSGKQSQTLARALWDDKTPLGGKGLRLTLQNLGYTPKLQRKPLESMPADAKFWLVLDPETRFSPREADLLLSWVKKGGILLFCVRPQSYFMGQSAFGIDSGEQSEGIERLRNALGAARSDGIQPEAGEYLPALSPLALDLVSPYRAGVKVASGSARAGEISGSHLEIAGPPGGTIARLTRGAGRALIFPDALLFTNYALSKGDNASLVANFFRFHAPRGAIYFDQRNGGDNAPNTAPPTLLTYLFRAPAVYALWQILAAALLFWAFASRRLGSPVALAPNAKVTRASQFAGAMGALFAKVGRPQAASTIIGARFRQRLAQRLALSPLESDAVLARRALEVAGIPFEITDRLLLQSRAPAESAGDALRDAQEMEQLLRRLEGRE